MDFLSSLQSPWQIYLPDYKSLEKINKNYQLIKNIISKLEIPFIDIRKEFLENKQHYLKYFPYELPGHYNIEGYKFVAETIYKYTNN